MTLKKIAIHVAVALGVLTVAVLLWQFRGALVLFIFSLAVTAMLRPLVERLAQRSLNRGLASLLVHLTLIAVAVGAVVLVSGPFFRELEALSDDLVFLYDRMWSVFPTGTQFQQTIINQLPPPNELYSSISGPQGSAIFQTVVGVTVGSFALLGNLFAGLVLSIYWTIDRVHFERLWLSLLPVSQRARARSIWRDIETGIGSYLRSELAQSLIAALLLGPVFALLGAPYPILLAIWAGLAWLVPWVGGLLAIVPVMAAALSMTPLAGTATVAVAVIILLLMELVVEPRLFHRNRYSSLLMLVLIIAMADTLGLVGILIAPPLGATIQLLFRHILQPGGVSPPELDPVRKIADLDDRIQEINQMMADMDEPPAPQSINMLARLSQLVSEANEMISQN